MTNNRKVIILDICDTLYPVNTTVGFVTYLLNKEDRMLSGFCRNIFLKYANAVIYKILNFDLIRYFLIRCIAGYSRQELNLIAKEYLFTLVGNGKIIDLIKEYRAMSYDVRFCSASLEPVVENVNDMFSGAGYSATTLKYDEFGVCKGFVLKDRLGRKVEEIKDIRNFYSEVVFVTDNKSDENCIVHCDKFFAVIPNGADAGFWGGKNVEIIKL